jgi:EAL domain-containing protein (putative c-di-GMP-specific phosphodiesterase class I)
LFRIEVISKKEIEELIESKSLLQHVIEAIYRKSVKFAVQKVVDVFSGKTVFHEALARLKLPNGEVVPAGMFIKLISNSSLEAELDKLMVEKVLESPELRKLGKISINLSYSFLQRKFPWFVAKLKTTNFPLKNLIIELTEKEDVLKIREIRNRLSALRKLGISIIIDDFGVQCSNYSILKFLEVDGVKIDGSVIRDVPSNELDKIFVSKTFQLAKVRNILVVAEFVETNSIVEILKCMAKKDDFLKVCVQGYLFGKPEIVE